MKGIRADFFTLLAVPVAVIAAAALSWAVSTSYWEVSHQEQFSAGTPRGVSIHSDGKVTLGPNVDLLADTGEPFVWCLATDSDGGIYAGTGNSGKIVKIARDGQQTVWYDADELEVLSLIAGPDRHLYAGTSPGGQIIRISPGGDAAVLFSTGEDHVWSLAFDGQGNLFAGTGAEGKIFKISPGGHGELFYDTKETNVTAMIWKDGHLYAGGAGSGLIYKIGRDGQGMMLFDAEEEEICDLIFAADGRLYAAATSGERPAGRPPMPEKPREQQDTSAENSQEMDWFVDETAGNQGTGLQFTGPSTVYQIDGLGSGQPLWRAPEGAMIFSMRLGPEGNLVVGTGDEGRVYSVNPDGSWSMLVEVEQMQVLTLLDTGPAGLLVGTGNMGAVFRLGRQYTADGTLESEVHDAFIVARWGRLTWEASTPSGTRVSLQTRSGNSEIPDETWSSWSKTYSQSSGEAVQSPPARFIQWRANISTSNKTATPSLEKIWLAYIQRNLAPKIQGLYVYPPGAENGAGRNLTRREGSGNTFPEGNQGAGSDPFGIQGPAVTGERKVSWQAFDPNGDELVFDLYFRGQGEQMWKPLKEQIPGGTYSWDSNLFPDGNYRLRLVASDSPDNPGEQALQAERISDPFVVDNTPPKVRVGGERGQNSRYRISGQAVDELSHIAELWYSVDAVEWKTLMAGDEVFDSPTEEFSFFTEALSAGEHIIVIRAVDMAGNVGAGKAIVR